MYSITHFHYFTLALSRLLRLLTIHILLENIGAVRELSKVTDNLGHRIDELETHTVRMSNLTRFGSIKSTGNGSVSSTSSQYKSSKRNRREGSIFRNAWIQGAILCLVGIMTICLLAMAILYILEYQRNNDDEETITEIPPNVTSLHSFPSTPPTVVTSRSSIVVNTKKGLSSPLTTRLPPYRTVTTTAPARTNKVSNHHSLEIGKPHNCADGKTSCESYCVSSSLSELTSDSVLIDDNTISAPGSDTTSRDLTEPEVVSSGGGQTELPDHLNQILHSGSEEEVEHDNTAVRREAEDEPPSPPPGNADNELLLSRQKTLNFVAEQLGEEREKKINELVGRLPRNRNYAETGPEGGGKVRPDQRLSLDVNEENEILEEEEDSKNITNLDTVEESRSSHVKKPSKLTGTPNEVRESFKQKDLSQDSTNLIEDSVKPQGRRAGSEISLRRKRNVSDNEDLSSANRASHPVSAPCMEERAEVRVKTLAGVFSLTENYCQHCRSAGNNCSYNIPLSKYAPDTQVAILFKVPVEHCSSSSSSSTPSLNNDIVSAPEAVEVLLDVPAGQNVTHHRFRISPGPQSSDLCIKTTPATFVEINLRLYRVC